MKKRIVLYSLLTLLVIAAFFVMFEMIKLNVREQELINKGNSACIFCERPLVFRVGAEHLHCALRPKPFHLHLSIKGWIQYLLKDYEKEEETKDRIREMGKEYFARE